MSGLVILGDMPSPGDPEKNLKDSYGRYMWHLIYCARLPVHDMSIEFLYDHWRQQASGASNLTKILAKHRDCKGHRGYGV